MTKAQKRLIAERIMQYGLEENFLNKLYEAKRTIENVDEIVHNLGVAKSYEVTFDDLYGIESEIFAIRRKNRRSL